MNDGDRTVAHGHHLTQTAGLEAGGHQIEIRARKDLAGHLLGVLVRKAELSRPASAALLKVFHIVGVALAEEDHLHAQLHELGQDLPDQLDPLLLHESRDRAQDREARLLIQPKLSLERRLAESLAAHILRREGKGQAFVQTGVIVIHVNAVEDAAQLAVHQVRHALQPAAEGGIVQLSRVGGGDGGHRVRHQHGPLHQVHVLPPLVEIAQAAVIPAPGQAEGVLELVGAILALIGDVVDGIDSLDLFQLAPVDGVVLQIDDSKRRLPVVAVQDLREEVQLVHQIDHRTAEPGKAQLVVVIAVELRPVEEGVVLHEPNRYAAVFPPPEGAGICLSVEAHRALPDAAQLLPEALLDAAVERRDHRDLIPLRLQRGGQRKGHVGQAPGFGEGGAFTAHKQNLHGLFPPYSELGERKRSPGPVSYYSLFT